ncbi:hypothetical protein K432DRAFT_350075 [Lepidopterella palustris CBS 459.81]|uniref:Uncharacterized protein n=1 Tax=Lepidopterella palustris CBS 459.81 TaxID=1314670 RepID=A0A8E2EDA7_9PEZI|nr:hypothetical protein K432DRAFT_350075 [Lepidopterella palustris CBS 459.81]
MHHSLLTNIILLLSLFHTAVIAAPKTYAAVLAVRQTSAPTDTQCLDYARTANLSTIGANSTYRSAFLQASRVGTIINGRMLDAAILKLPALTGNEALNQACGNLTTVAFTEAERNFTMGIVAQFSGLVGNPQTIKAGPELVPIMGLIVFIFGGVWSFMP